jgi:hypothetical protein
LIGEEGAGRGREPQRVLLILGEGKAEGGEGEKGRDDRRADRSMDINSAPHTYTHRDRDRGVQRLAPSSYTSLSRFMKREGK